jgi:hypothetical protein
MSRVHRFTSATAPRTGRVKGSRNRITAQSMKVIDALLADFAKHGKAAIDILRVEKPAEYVRVCADIAAKWVAKSAIAKLNTYKQTRGDQNGDENLPTAFPTTLKAARQNRRKRSEIKSLGRQDSNLGMAESKSA